MTREITSTNIQSSCSRFAWQDSIEPLRQTLSLSEPTGMTEVIGETPVNPGELTGIYQRGTLAGAMVNRSTLYRRGVG